MGKKSKRDLERLVEAQARGEDITEVPTEDKAPEGKLDRRVSKGGNRVSGVVTSTG